MNPDQVREKINALVPDSELGEEGLQFPTFNVPADKMRGLAEMLRKDCDFDFLFCQTALDYADHMLVVYHLRSTSDGTEIVVKARIEDRDKAEIATVSDIWKTAEFHEREVFDLFGINFTNHPDMRRIFLEDDWIGWPLRKDYVDEINLIVR